MNLRPTFTRPTKSVLAGILVIASLAIGWTAGTVAASGGSRAASPTTAPKEVGADTLAMPEASTTTTLPQYAGGATTSGGTASSIAYPVPGYNPLGVAPEGTVLVEGTGSADMKPDGADEAAALKEATDAAFADAHAQALAAAASMVCNFRDLLGQHRVKYELHVSNVRLCGRPLAPGTATGATASAGSAPASPPVACPGIEQSTPTTAQLVVTLTVAYKYA